MITEKRANGGGWKVAGGLALTVAMVAVACETPAPTGVNEGAVPPPATEAVAAGEAPASSDAAGPDGTGEPAGTFELREVEDRDPLRSIPEGALVVVDGVIVDDPEASFEVTRLDVERVEVVRPPVAEELYGARAKNGVVVVTTKAAARREGGAGRYEVREEGRARYEALEEVRVRPKTPAGNPVVYVDGVRVEGGLGAAVIEPRKVDRVEVVKGEAARAIYGEKARDGVVQIFTKERPAATGGVVRLRELPAKRPTVGPIDDAVIFVDGERWTGTAESLGELAIESMEVLSGEAAAAVLEGSGIDGSRKVIRVTTKR